ncbi:MULTISPECIES: hypothetical protein [Paenibacillus]|nr:hypothetical protein [Paenibacillus caseinilyticus]
MEEPGNNGNNPPIRYWNDDPFIPNVLFVHNPLHIGSNHQVEIGALL